MRKWTPFTPSLVYKDRRKTSEVRSQGQFETLEVWNAMETPVGTPAPAEDANSKAGGRRRLQKGVGSFVAGSAAGIISTAGLQPLEVVKTHMQARDGPHGHSIRGAMKTVAERDGLKGFWRGTGPACVRVGFGAGLYFAMLGPIMSTLQKTSGLTSTFSSSAANPMHEKMPASIAASAGALTRLLASIITCPITVIKTRMEVPFRELPVTR